MIKNTYRSVIICAVLSLMSLSLFSMDWGRKQLESMGFIKKPEQLTMAKDLSSLEERAKDIKTKFIVLEEAIKTEGSQGSTSKSQKNIVDRYIGLIKDSGKIPQNKESTRFKILDLIAQAANPKVFNIIRKNEAKRTVLFDAIDKIAIFSAPELVKELEEDLPKGTANAAEDMSASAILFGESKSELENVIESAFAELYRPMPDSLKERIAIIRQWKDKNAKIIALQLLAAHDLEIASESKDDDKFHNSMPVFNALWSIGSSLPSKVETQDTVMYKVHTIGLLQPIQLMKFARDGEGDVLKGFCSDTQPSNLQISTMCSFVKNLPPLRMKEVLGEDKKETTKPTPVPTVIGGIKVKTDTLKVDPYSAPLDQSWSIPASKPSTIAKLGALKIQGVATDALLDQSSLPVPVTPTTTATSTPMVSTAEESVDQPILITTEKADQPLNITKTDIEEPGTQYFDVKQQEPDVIDAGGRVYEAVPERISVGSWQRPLIDWKRWFKSWFTKPQGSTGTPVATRPAAAPQPAANGGVLGTIKNIFSKLKFW